MVAALNTTVADVELLYISVTSIVVASVVPIVAPRVIVNVIVLSGIGLLVAGAGCGALKSAVPMLITMENEMSQKQHSVEMEYVKREKLQRVALWTAAIK